MRPLPPLAALLRLALPAAAQTAGGYAGQQAREIEALWAEETADLPAGRGMGLARAGELNGYPGPAHVLELHDRLGLSADQLAAVRASFERMQAAACSVGSEVVKRERALDAAFCRGSITPATLAAETVAIGAL